MWDSFLYVMNVLLPLVIKKVLASQWLSAGNPKRYSEKVGRVKEIPCSCQRKKTPAASQNITGRSQPHGNTQINRYGLI